MLAQLVYILSHLKKIIFNHSEGGWEGEGQNKSVPYTTECSDLSCSHRLHKQTSAADSELPSVGPTERHFQHQQISLTLLSLFISDTRMPFAPKSLQEVCMMVIIKHELSRDRLPDRLKEPQAMRD